MDWVELLRASRLLAAGQPSQEALRRAVSTAYYAMFHALANSNADLIAGPRTPANQSNWTAIYRSLRHYRAENPLHGWPHLFSPPVQNFAVVIAAMPRTSSRGCRLQPQRELYSAPGYYLDRPGGTGHYRLQRRIPAGTRHGGHRQPGRPTLNQSHSRHRNGGKPVVVPQPTAPSFRRQRVTPYHDTGPESPDAITHHPEPAEAFPRRC